MRYSLVILSGGEVLEMIQPADPDSFTLLAPTSRGVYRAMWSETNPALATDVLIIKTHPRVQMVRAEYHPDFLPKWTAIDFQVFEEAADNLPNT